VHIDADRQRGVAAREATRRDDHVVERRDAEPAELHGNRSCKKSASLDRGEALVREARFAVVEGGTARYFRRESLGERDEAPAGLGGGHQLARHLRFLSDVGPNER
jgi:hypothetical protein